MKYEDEIVVNSHATRGEFWTTKNPTRIPFWWQTVMRSRVSRHGRRWRVYAFLRGRG